MIMKQKIVIIGGVAAGPKAACRLKRLVPDAEVIILEQDTLFSYGGCGIPYFVSGDVSDEKELRSTSFHVIRDEAFFANAKGVEVKTSTRALAIDRKNKTVAIQYLPTGSQEEIPYDKLVLATGSRPNRLSLPGVDLAGVYTIGDLHKAIAIKEELGKGQLERAVIIGGGSIGIEMAEAFGDLWGVETTLIETMGQLLPRIVDRHFAGMLEAHLRQNDVQVCTNESVQRLEGDESGRVCRAVTSLRTIETDIVVMAVGVQPRCELAKEAGLLVGSQGGIVVNQRMQTSDPDIFAAGDCVEILNLVSGSRETAPLGSLANRQGRVVADNIAGVPSTFNGWVGSFVMKAFDCSIAAVGLSLEASLELGYDADVALTAQSDRAHFFPNQTVIPLQMVFDRRSGRVLGVQGFGPMGDAVLARIDAAAALLAKRGTIEDFSQLEMAYAPPFSTAIDALNATANVAENALAGRLRVLPIDEFLAWMDDFSCRKDWVALDIRHPAEASVFMEKFGRTHWLTIPYVEVRNRYMELPKDKTLIIICDAGTRSYEIQCFLDSEDMKNNLVLGGGFNIIRRLGVSWWPQD